MLSIAVLPFYLGWNVHMEYMLRKKINVGLRGLGGYLTGGTFS